MLSRLPWTPKPFKKKRKARNRGVAAQREPIVRRVMRILDAGEPTKFAFEGACWHGLRSRLCLEGQPWAAADKFAGEVVAEALRRIGASRPSWLEGQRDAAQVEGERRWTCAWPPCGRPIPEDRGEHVHGQGVKYCSDGCAQLAVDVRNRHTLQNATAAAAAAWRATRASVRKLTKVCIGCGETFSTPLEWRQTHRQYCSADCRDEHRLKWAPRPCAACGKTFKPTVQARKYCSRKCMGDASVKPGGERICRRCGRAFTVRWACPPNQFCSRKCGLDNAREVRYSDVQWRKARTCAKCGRAFTVKLPSMPNKFCSHRCYVDSLRAPREGNGFACEAAE